MSRIMLFAGNVLFIAVMALGMAGVVADVHLTRIAHAQDATALPDATPVVVSGGDTITIEQSPTVPVESTTPLFDIGKALPFLSVIILLIVLLVVEVVDKRRLAEIVARSMTPEVFAVFSAAINKGVADAGAYVALTPSPLDDALYNPTKAQVDDLLARIQVLEDAKGAQVVNNINPQSSSADASTRGGSGGG